MLYLLGRDGQCWFNQSDFTAPNYPQSIIQITRCIVLSVVAVGRRTSLSSSLRVVLRHFVNSQEFLV